MNAASDGRARNILAVTVVLHVVLLVSSMVPEGLALVLSPANFPGLRTQRPVYLRSYFKKF